MSSEDEYYSNNIGKPVAKVRMKLSLETTVFIMNQWHYAHHFPEGHEVREAYFWLLNERDAEYTHEKDSRKQTKKRTR